MDDKAKLKLKIWEDKLVKTRAEYEVVMQKRGEAMQMGDLRENAAFQMLSEDADTYRARIIEVENIIEKIKEGSN